jgi:hypothetical protein
MSTATVAVLATFNVVDCKQIILVPPIPTKPPRNVKTIKIVFRSLASQVGPSNRSAVGEISNCHKSMRLIWIPE